MRQLQKRARRTHFQPVKTRFSCLTTLARNAYRNRSNLFANRTQQFDNAGAPAAAVPRRAARTWPTPDLRHIRSLQRTLE
jgi:hypothetical protein